MAGRPTIRDVADAAGVSPATVDRVLNGRAVVREETVRRVAEAAHRIGYHARGLLEARLDATVPQVRLGFVLHKERQEFYRNFRRELEEAVAARTDIRGTAEFRFSPSQGAEDFVANMTALAGRTDVLACSAINHPNIDRAVTELAEAGKPVFALLNDFGQGVRENYFGLNNMRVGRIAGWMAATAARGPGKMAVFVGGSRWHGHQLRETGFRSYIRDSPSGYQMLDTLVNLETRKLTYEATLELLDRQGDVVGIYVAGGGMEGAIAALREVRPAGRVVLIVNELTAESRAGLIDGYVTMVVATPLRDLCRELVGAMISSIRPGAVRTGAQRFLEPQIYLPESV